MRASTKRAFSLLVSAGFLIGAMVLYGAFIKPAYDNATMLRGTMFAKQQLFDEKKQAVDKVSALVAQYQGAGRLQDVILLSLPSREDVSSVFNQLQAIALLNDMGINVFNVQLLPLKPASDDSLVEPVGTVRVSLRLTGSYESFKDFIRGLETNIRVMDVVSIKIEPAGAPGRNFFSYTVVADTYYQGN